MESHLKWYTGKPNKSGKYLVYTAGNYLSYIEYSEVYEKWNASDGGEIEYVFKDDDVYAWTDTSILMNDLNFTYRNNIKNRGEENHKD